MSVPAGAALLAIVSAALWLASPALGAFPGANGLLAVQPQAGGIDAAPAFRSASLESACPGEPRRNLEQPGRVSLNYAPQIVL
jgi:hypothetical protein